MLVAVDDLVQFVPDESQTRLSIAAYSAEQLHVRPLTFGRAHDEKCDTKSPFLSSVINASGQLRVSDNENIVLGELLQAGQVSAVRHGKFR